MARTKPMTKEQLAALLNGREYRDEITRKEAEQAKKDGLLVIYGASDDLAEFDGLFRDETGCSYGRKIRFGLEGPLEEWDDYEEKDKADAREWFTKEADTKFVVEALWCKEEPYSWTFKTDLPHATFDILEDGNKFCRGIVIDSKDLT